MKNLSKVLAVVLAFAMALSMVSFAAYTDVAEGDSCEEAVTVLSALDILTGYEDGSFKPEATITRAEFAAVVIRMLGYADIAAGGSTIFTDVAADHWANGVIALAAQQGIVNGYGDGRFGPEDPVKYEEAIKMIVAALGYTPMADANGGYPGGYQVVAAQRGILAGVVGTSGTPATRATVAQMAYNALPVPMMEQSSYGTQVAFSASKQTALTKLGVAKVEGEVVGTEATDANLKGKVKVHYKEQYVALGGTDYGVYTIAVDDEDYSKDTNLKLAFDASEEATIKVDADVEQDAIDLIDANSIMYVKDGTSTTTATLVCILENKDSNETVTFASEDINDEDTDVDANKLAVYTDADAGEYDEYTLAIDKVYVNGRTDHITVDVDGAGDLTAASSTVDNEAAVIEYFFDSSVSADIKLMSTEEDKWTVAYITTYVDGVVSAVTPAVNRVKFTLSDDSSDYVVLDTKNKTYSFAIYKDGEEATIEDIAENDVISIAGYRVGDNELKYGTVYVSSEKLEGKVTGTNAGVIYVDGEKYNSADADNYGITAGKTATFYLNARGVIIGLDETESKGNLKYGFASYIYEDVFGEAQVRLLTSDGVWASVEIADKLTFSAAGDTIETETEKSIDWSADLLGVAANYNGKSEMTGINDVVAYELNANGEIDELYTASVADSKLVSEAGSTNAYNETMGTLAGKDVDDTTVIFSIAGAESSKVTNKDEVIEEKNVTVVSLASLTDGEDYVLDTVYNEDDRTFIAGAILGVDLVGGIDWTDNFFVVTSSMSTINDAGDEGTLISGLVAGEEATLFIADTTTDIKKAAYSTTENATANSGATVAATDIAKGDILLYTVDGKGEAAKVVVLLQAAGVKNDDADYGKLARPGTSVLPATTVIANFDKAGVKSSYIFGYAAAETKGRFNINNTYAIGGDQYRFASDAEGAIYNAFVGTASNPGKVSYALSSNLLADTGDVNDGADANGDMIFARVNANNVISDFVIFSNDR